MTDAMDNKDVAELLECAKYYMQLKNYERAEEFVRKAQKLYPTKEAEELLAEVLSKKKKPELADQEHVKGTQKKLEPTFNLRWTRVERMQNMHSHEYSCNSNEMEANATGESWIFAIGAGLGMLTTILLGKSIFDCMSANKNKY